MTKLIGAFRNVKNTPKMWVNVGLDWYSDTRQNFATLNCGARQDASYSSYSRCVLQRSLFRSVMQRAARILHEFDANWRILFLDKEKSVGLQECTQQLDEIKPAESLKIRPLSTLDLMKYCSSFLYRVIRNDCRSFNNLSNTIHLR